MTSIGGGLKALIEEWGGVEGRVFRDRADAGSEYPYVTFDDYLADPDVLTGDGEAALSRIRILQADLWFESKDSEDHELVRTLKAALDRVKVPTATEHVLRLRVENVLRRPDWDSQVVGYTFDLRASYLTFHPAD